MLFFASYHNCSLTKKDDVEQRIFYITRGDVLAEGSGIRGLSRKGARRERSLSKGGDKKCLKTAYKSVGVQRE